MSLRDRGVRKSVDIIALGCYLALVLIGWLSIYSVEFDGTHNLLDLSSRHSRQLIFIILSLLVGGAILVLERNFIQAFSFPAYGASMLLLVATLVLGTVVAGSKSWIDLGFFRLQPSELAKTGTILALAAYLSNEKIDLRSLKPNLVAGLMILLPVALVLLQGDAGSAMVFLALSLILLREGTPGWVFVLPTVIVITLIAALSFEPLQVVLGLSITTLVILGATLKKDAVRLTALALGISTLGAFAFTFGYPIEAIIGVAITIIIYAILHFRARNQVIGLLLPIAAVLLSGIAFAANLFFRSMPSYRQDRINVWLNPKECDPLGALYNVTQSKLAIGSGGITGRGYLNGSMTNLNYVPEQATDFIYCAIGEQWGFLGSVLVLCLFAGLILRIIAMAEQQRSRFGRIYGYGFAGVLLIHLLINVGMTIGLMPIIGIPLPFISSGGSSLLAFSIAFFIFLKLDSSRLQVFR